MVNRGLSDDIGLPHLPQPAQGEEGASAVGGRTNRHFSVALRALRPRLSHRKEGHSFQAWWDVNAHVGARGLPAMLSGGLWQHLPFPHYPTWSDTEGDTPTLFVAICFSFVHSWKLPQTFPGSENSLARLPSPTAQKTETKHGGRGTGHWGEPTNRGPTEAENQSDPAARPPPSAAVSPPAAPSTWTSGPGPW